MTIFFILAGLLLLFVSAIVVKLWRARQHEMLGDDDANWQVLLAKRNEIEQDALLPPQIKEDLRGEWVQTADIVLSRSAPTTTVSATPGQAWILGASVLVMTIAVYALTGRWDREALAWNGQPFLLSNAKFSAPPRDGEAHPGSPETLEQRMRLLEEKLEKNPDDLAGWVLLSRSHAQYRNFAKAAAALEHALTLAPGHPDLLADLADMLAMTANASLAGKPSQLIEQALQAEPNHRKALSLAATEAIQHNDPLKAIRYWKRLRATFLPDAPEVIQIDAIIANLSTASAGDATPAPAEKLTAGIEGRVTLAPELIAEFKKQRWPESAVLFVLARNPKGPPMPVAALRLSAQKLASGEAVAFRLDDSQAMSPTNKLSALTEVDIEARIAMAGTAARQPGDLSVVLSHVKVGAKNLHLVIPPPR